jgi:transmembrane protein 18
LIDQILSDVRMNATVTIGYDSLVESARAFVAAVDWSERWIQAVVALHVFLLVVIILTRTHFWVQVGLFVFMAVVGLLAQPLNHFLSQHWSAFATQNYFDANGFFISVFLSMPFITLMVLQLVLILYYAMQLLVALKTAEARYKRRRNKERDERDKALKAEEKEDEEDDAKEKRE